MHCAHLTSTAVCSRRGEKRESRASQKAGRGLGGEGNLHKTPVRPAAGVSDRLLRLKEAGHVPARSRSRARSRASGDRGARTAYLGRNVRGGGR